MTGPKHSKPAQTASLAGGSSRLATPGNFLCGAFIAAAAFVALPGASAAQDAGKQVSFISASGESMGTATLTDTPAGLLLELDLTGLTTGWHAFHIHQEGVCDPAEGFSTAGGHYAGGAHAHGFEVEDGPHAGDMPNQYAAADGVLKAQVINPHVTLTGENAVTGRALILHAGPDDYESQPSGDAGGRVGCAVIEG